MKARDFWTINLVRSKYVKNYLEHIILCTTWTRKRKLFHTTHTTFTVSINLFELKCPPIIIILFYSISILSYFSFFFFYETILVPKRLCLLRVHKSFVTKHVIIISNIKHIRRNNYHVVFLLLFYYSAAIVVLHQQGLKDWLQWFCNVFFLYFLFSFRKK